MDRLDIIQKIFEAGIVGEGGAGFPTHKKLVKGAEWLIVNAAECEPLLNSDRYVMRTFADEIIQALIMLKDELSPANVVIGTKEKYHEEILALRAAIERHNAPITLFCFDSTYPAGDEQVLVYEVTGKTTPPGGIPIQVGAIVINVATAYDIYRAANGESLTHKYVTVTGEVNKPSIVRVPVGTSVSACIEAAGGAAVGDWFFIMGGPMMGRRLDKSQAETTYIKKTDGGIIVLETSHIIKAISDRPLAHITNQAKSACVQCCFCTDMCPRYLLGHKLRPNRVMRALATGTNAADVTEALLCSECGMCEMYACPMGLSPRRVNVAAKAALREQNAKPADKTVYTGQTAMREGRKVPQSRLIARLGLTKYPNRLTEMLEYTPDTVHIALKQSLGRPAEPVVTPGARVRRGELIAQAGLEQLSANVHASVDGVVRSVSDDIVIDVETEAVRHEIDRPDRA